MSELLPCPFCGGEDLVHHNDAWESYIFCNYCGCELAIPENKSDVMQFKKWNTRANADTIARLEAENARLLAVIAKSALSLLENNGDAITDTIWLTSDKLSPTLYEHLCAELSCEFTGDLDEDIAALRALSNTPVEDVKGV